MADTNGLASDQTLPAKVASTNGNPNGQPTMPYSCLSCSKKKVRCDKATPRCASCCKVISECVYQAPPPRRRKRKLSGGGGEGSNDVNLSEKLARYEQILHQHGLLPRDVDPTLAAAGAIDTPMSLRYLEPEVSRTGKLVAGQGKSRYVNSGLWRSLEDDEMPPMSEDEEDQCDGDEVGAWDPLTGAFLGRHQSLLYYHPTRAQAMELWETHVDKVEPLCKVLHIPTTTKMVEAVTQQPAMASKADECLLFAIYHFAVYSMTETECVEKLGQSKATSLQAYHFAAKQALVNASFLKSTEVSIMQAFILFLQSSRHTYDPHVFWILTGIAVRIAQRMGLHRDGEALGLPPFEVQMRRRVFYQVIPLDGMASRMTGTSICMMPESWDTKAPLNLNDDQIWPGIIEMPEEQKGATEMIYCLSRACVAQFFLKAGMGSPAQ